MGKRVNMTKNKTALFNLHQTNKAKFVEFAGYEMPIQYEKGIVEEHKITRSAAGIFDVSHMGQLFIYGDNKLTEDLEKIFPLNLKELKVFKSKYSFLMNDQAGIYDDLIITKLEEGYLIILNAACKDDDFKIIKELLGKNYKYELKDDRSLVAIQGPSAVQILNDIIPEVNKLNFMSGGWFNYYENKIFVTRSGYTGEDGFEISVPNSLVEEFTKSLMSKGAELIGLGARDTLRLEAGLCLYGHELNTNLTPIEANLNWAISKSRLDDMNFIGSAMIKEQLSQGTKQLRVGIQPEGRIIAREKTKIFNDKDQIIGEITSGTFGPSVNGPIAMGYIDSEYSNKNSKIFLEIRGKKHPANICGLPFYKKSYVKGAA
jgi:aminomethyltransferase